MTAWAVNLAGLVLVGSVVWWFWLSRPRALQAGSGPIEVRVEDGVYTPARIEVPVGRPVTLRFLRRDPSPCAERVVFSELGLSATLPIGKPADLRVIAPEAGEYTFTCEMHMYRGTLVAR